MQDKIQKASEPTENATQTTLEEFSLMELDERLEFVAWCNSGT